uniref:Uncharacterized protein n=1 Tax=Lepeophtheirus salmonis TaxID=72036 RepID=A0A0K2TRA6_LEPSM
MMRKQGVFNTSREVLKPIFQSISGEINYQTIKFLITFWIILLSYIPY